MFDGFAEPGRLRRGWKQRADKAEKAKLAAEAKAVEKDQPKEDPISDSAGPAESEQVHEATHAPQPRGNQTSSAELSTSGLSSDPVESPDAVADAEGHKIEAAAKPV